MTGGWLEKKRTYPYYYSGIRIFASDKLKHQNLMDGFYFSYTILRFD